MVYSGEFNPPIQALSVLDKGAEQKGATVE